MGDMAGLPLRHADRIIVPGPCRTADTDRDAAIGIYHGP